MGGLPPRVRVGGRRPLAPCGARRASFDAEGGKRRFLARPLKTTLNIKILNMYGAVQLLHHRYSHLNLNLISTGSVLSGCGFSEQTVIPSIYLTKVYL